MGTSNLRSLLLAAIVLSNCITWTASRHHYTHNVNGHRSRHRRQGAGLFLPASYVVPGGEGTGAWGEWGEVTPCSRTCGGGVASQKRICLELGSDGQPRCTGGDTKYFSCQTHDCPDDAGDFRAEQCAEYNDKIFRDNNMYFWVPYTKAHNPCELNCMPRGERFYYRHRTKVVDGTRCNDESFDVCVNGTCQAVGCDMMLGSNAREDKCRECRGNGTNCRTMDGFIGNCLNQTGDCLTRGYNDVLLIPQGATNILIEEVNASSNYLALRAKQHNKFYLNGDYHIDFPRSLMIAGALWHYERSQQGFAAPDKLRCIGPTNEPLYLSLLLQEDNVGVKYEYSIPSALAPRPTLRYDWVFDQFSPCSATCGGGFQMRTVSCRSRDDLEQVDESLCEEMMKPATNQTCNTQACAPRWVEGPWSPCSRPCGEGGTRSRQIHCEKIITNGLTFRFPSVVSDKECSDLLGAKPNPYEDCNQNATCPIWFTGPWKPCNKLCGEGVQTRQVVCHTKTDGRVEVFDDNECTDEKPSSEQPCNLHPCGGIDIVLSEWSGCDSCLSINRTRMAKCVTEERKVVDYALCAYHPEPVLEEPCDKSKLPACEMQWYATQWSNCSVECGKGNQTRRVFCGALDGQSVVEVNDSLCDKEMKYRDSKPCEVPKEKCPAKWFAGPWTRCSEECGGGNQTRPVMCLIGDQEVGRTCLQNDIPDFWQSCNIGPCNEDQILPLDSKSSPIMDDYYYYDDQDCEDDDEVGAESSGDEKTDINSQYIETKVPIQKGEGNYDQLLSLFETSSGSGSSIDELTSTTDYITDEGSGFGITDLTGSEETSSITESSSTTESTETYSTDFPNSSTSSDSSQSEIYSSNSDLTTTEISNIETTSTKSTEISSTGPTGTDNTDINETGSTDAISTSSTEISETGSTEIDSTLISTTEETSSTKLDSTGSSTTAETSSTIVDSTVGGSTTEEISTTDLVDTVSSTIAETSSTKVDSTVSSTTEEISTTELVNTVSSTIDEISTTELVSTVSSTIEEISTTELVSTVSSTIAETSSTKVDILVSSTTEETELVPTASSTIAETSSTTVDNIVSSTTEEISTTELVSTVSSTIAETSSTEVDTTVSSTTESGTTNSVNTEISRDVTEDDVSTTKETSTTNIISSTPEASTEFSTTENEDKESSTERTSSTEESITETTTSSKASESEQPSTSDIWSTSTTESISSSTETTTGSETVSEWSEASTTEAFETTMTGVSTTETSTEYKTRIPDYSTTMDWGATITEVLNKRRCRPWKVAKCKRSKYGCCPDMRTPANGTFDQGCPKPQQTCKDTKDGCCSDGVSPAKGPNNKGCPLINCNETLYGCCLSDNTTPAEGNDQEGCPKPLTACQKSKYGCCADGNTIAQGLNKQGCPETETTQAPVTELEGCFATEFGCCTDNETEATGPDGAGCPCNTTEFGCCPDGLSPASGANMEGCIMSCNNSAYGCCPDGQTPAHGPEYEGCCLQSAYGCCPDNYKPAEGPHLEGCGCQIAQYGCCPDNFTIARGPSNEGCGCQYTQFGCCPDRHTEAKGPDYLGCHCSTYQFGCCPDGRNAAKGPSLQGCLCHHSEYGCCGDEKTAAKGPSQLGCDCSSSKFGCCPDGVTEASGNKFLNCTDVPENRQAACSLKVDRGPCRNFSVYWYYDMSYGGCSRFWYGGCEGNGNRFSSQEDCQDICVQPAPKDACKLPKVKGACQDRIIRWYYESTREQCSQFEFGGCLGNANNFESREVCQKQCEPARTEDQCNLPIERGSCAGNFGRWGYNSELGRCEQFIWGGCEGNPNRFVSEAACLQRCSPPGVPKTECSLPQVSGNCTEKLALWAFRVAENRCVPFYYSGCGGNGNRFDSQASCALACPSTYEQDTCTQPALTGDCSDYTLRWFYDTSAKRCRQFYYGGCGGNDNNFMSEEHCKGSCFEQPTTTPAPPPPAPVDNNNFCFLARDPGPCTQFESRWVYEATRGDCIPFEYGGCGGNSNNFADRETCRRYCSQTQDACQLPVLPGPCREWSIHWFYDARTDSCQQFQYGGCEGNDNRFESRQACEQRCQRQEQIIPAAVTTTAATTTTTTAATTTTTTAAATTTTTTTTTAPMLDIPAGCLVSLTLEECVEAGQVWYFDVRRRTCVAHTNPPSGTSCYRRGTYPSQEACERSCGSLRDINVCRYQVDAGPCHEYIQKVYFDEASSSCQHFMYGGCHGGPNRFSSIEECEEVCKPETDPCRQRVEPGNCVDYHVLWYFDEERDACGQFAYTGCGGNDNRFQTQDDCEGRCKRRDTTTVLIAQITTTTPTTTTAITSTTTYLPPKQVEREECRTPDSLDPCGKNITTYYYDTKTGVCVRGDFGACGYANSYSSEEGCERQCGAFRNIDVCRAVVDPGPCVHSVDKVYWDIASGRCRPFAYSGCLGGANRFSSVQECEEVCGGSGPVDIDNNVLPDCQRFDRHCARLRCEGQLQRRLGADGCTHCICVAAPRRTPAPTTAWTPAPTTAWTPAPTTAWTHRPTPTPAPDCEPARRACAALQCPLQVEKFIGPDGCETCQCWNPCDGNACSAGERCVYEPYRDPLSDEPSSLPECRPVNKSGVCPVATAVGPGCDRTCADDADCRGVGKCCARGCQHVCLPPVSAVRPTAPAPATTTYTPDVPSAPLANAETLPEVSALEGGVATLRCLFHGNPPPRITWRRHEITIESDRERYRLLSDGALEIVSIYPNDTGVYICIGTNRLGSSRQSVQLVVNAPVEGPAGIAGPPRAVALGRMGRALHVRCLAYGYPAPAIYWYHGRNGPMVPYSSDLFEARGNVLQIRSLIPEALGEYICQAYNGIGKPAEWSVIVQLDQPEGTPRTMGEMPTEPTTTTTTLGPQIDFRVGIPSYAGVYNVPVTTRITTDRTTLAAGSEVNIRCDVDGYPQPDVFWTKDSVRLVPTDRIALTEARLTISGANINDSGEYGCHASNAFSSNSASVRIIVQGLYIPAKCKDNPFFAKCELVVRSKFCNHEYYSSFCCKSCVLAGQLDPLKMNIQSYEAWKKK